MICGWSPNGPRNIPVSPLRKVRLLSQSAMPSGAHEVAPPVAGAEIVIRYPTFPLRRKTSEEGIMGDRALGKRVIATRKGEDYEFPQMDA